MQDLPQSSLEFGGSNALSGASTSRTLMLSELSTLLAATVPETTSDEYKNLIVGENVLMKPSAATRIKTYRSLRDRYALDPAVPVFNLLRLLWDRDPAGQALLALLVAAFRDPVLRSTIPAITGAEVDQALDSNSFRPYIRQAVSGRFTSETLDAAAERATSTYKQTSHLRGRIGGRRQRVTASPGSVTAALLFASLEGRSGHALLESDWVKLLDSPPGVVLGEAQLAATRGWLEYRHAGGVLEISFRQLREAIGAPA